MEGIDRMEWSRPAELPGVERMSLRGCRKLFRQYHEAYAICVAWSPGSEWVYRRKKQLIGAGDVGLMEPGEVHYNTRVTGSGDCDVFFVLPERMDDLARESGLRAAPHLTQSQPADPLLHRAWASLAASLDRPASTLEREERFLAAVTALLGYGESRTNERESRNRQPALRARDLLRERWHETLSLGELADAVRVSRFHLARAFRRELGLPPHAYQVQLRLAHARTLLRAGLPTAEVASAAGFADQSHLTRHFRKAFGLTPARYAALHR